MRGLVAYLIFTRQVIPWVARMMASLFWFSVLSITIFWRHVPQQARDLAYAWQDQVIRAGTLRDWDKELFTVFHWAAWITILACWLLLSYLTVWTIGIFF